MVEQAPKEEKKLEIPEIKENKWETQEVSSLFKNPEIGEKVDKIVKSHKNPKIEKDFINYLKKIKPEDKNDFENALEENKTDSETSKAIIDGMIEKSIQELPVFESKENKTDIIKMYNDATLEKNDATLEKNDATLEKNDATLEKNNATLEKNNATEYKEKVDQLFLETEQARQSLLQTNPQLNIKIGVKEQEEFKASDIGKSLIGKGATDEQINNYVLFKATQKAIESDPSVKKEECSNFLISLKKLENQLDIPDIKVEDFSSKNIGETSREIFNKDTGNQNLITTVEVQKEAHASDYGRLFASTSPEKSEEKLQNNYTKFKNFLSSDEQKNYEKIQGKIRDRRNFYQKKKQKKKWLNQKLNSLEQQFQETTKTSMEQASVLGPIMGLANYMDTNIGNAFTWNKSNDIAIKDDLLSITGTIDNKPFTLVNYLKTPSKLQTSDYLHQNNEKEFVIGPESKQDTPFIMPGKADIRATITWEFTENHENILKNSKSLEDYQQTIQKNMCEKTKELYGYKELVQIRMEKQMQKDVAAQEALNMLSDTLFDGRFIDLKDVSQDNTLPPLFNYIKDLDYNLENLSGEEIQQFRNENKEIKRILEQMKKDKNKSQIGILNKTLSPESIENTKNIIERKEIREPSLFTLFETSKNPQTKIWNIKELGNMLEENKKAEPNKNLYANIEENRQKDNATKNMLEKRPKDAIT